MKRSVSLACALIIPAIFAQSASAEFNYKDYIETDGSFKRFSISAGWLHASPDSNATAIRNITAVPNGTVAQNGSVKVDTVVNVIDPNQPAETLKRLELLSALDGATDLANSPLGDVSGTTTINGLESWSSVNTGLEADDTDTFGLLLNYFINDHWSVEMKAGVPPKVDILGKGTVYAPFSGRVAPAGAAATTIGEFDIVKNIEITNMTQGDKAASARAWLPATEVHYQFGKQGVNKFRPYVGAGVIVAHFTDLELNTGIESDLKAAGHMIENIRTGRAGASLEGVSSGNPMYIDLDAETTVAPIFTLGATYDFNEDWFGVGSVTYANLDSDTTIRVKNSAGEQLIQATANIEIDPYITYLGVGYRF